MIDSPSTQNPETLPIASDTTTHNVRILVRPQFKGQNIGADGSLYVYTYHITIVNEGVETVQLISRHWIIKDGFNKVDHVVGDGVVGQKPVLRPGEKFSYSSFCPLNTPTGSMQGSFQMKSEKKGETFDAFISEFQLRDNALVN